MHYIDDFKGPQRLSVAAELGPLIKFEVGNLDVLMLDIQNDGVSPLTGLKIFGRSSARAPMRDLTPTAWTAASALLWQPAFASPVTLAVAADVRFGLNVTALYEVEIRASGAGAVLLLSAGGYKVWP